MELSRRASYNLLRHTWLQDPSIKAGKWQVEDYRSLSDSEILSRLADFGIILHYNVFLETSYNFDSPEDYVNSLPQKNNDEVFLLIFELWRRFTPEKLSLSIFCDELDHQISLFDSGTLDKDETIQDTITHLQNILDENTDEGANPADIFQWVCAHCFHNLEDFIYDYTLLQMELGNESYASELVDGFGPYLKGSKWFELLEIHLLALSNPEEALEQLKKVVGKAIKDEDFEYNLDILTFMAQLGDEKDFVKLAKKTIPLLEIEEDFKDLLSICKEYYHFLDLDAKEGIIEHILRKRHALSNNDLFDKNDPHIQDLLKIF